jgi:predicted DNA-binding transcriptional regulator AlpA
MADIIPIKKRELDDDAMLVTLRVSDMRALIRAEQSAGIDVRMGPDRLIDITEAAHLLAISEDYIYHNLKTLPFVKRLGPRVLRFSFNGIQKYIASKA